MNNLESQGIESIAQSTVFNIGGGLYRLKSQIDIPYLDWTGAYAGVYIAHPMKKETVILPPNHNLDGHSEIPEYALQLVQNMVSTFHTLKRKTPEELKESKQSSDLEALSQLLEAT